jgi:hypothetical protein
MRIEQLLEQNKYNSQSILQESCDGLTLEQRRIVEGIYNEFVPLIEASLTADQITQIFSTVEKSATDAGGNRTMLGKAADIPGQVNDVINKVGKYLQDTTPVKMADQKFEQLKAKVGAKFPDLDKQLTGMGTWMKENPGKSAAIIGLLTVLASLAGGPVGGAIAGQALKGAAELIKGEKLSTAIGKGLKAAAVGWLAGKSMEAVGKMIANAYEYFNPQPIHGFVQYYQENIGNGLPNIFRDAHIVGNKEQLGQFNQMWGSAAKQWQSGNFEGARDAFSQAQDFAIKITNDTYTAMGTTDPGEPIRKLKDLFVGLSAAAQGAATGAAGYDKQGKPVEAAKESYYRQSRPLSEGQVYLVFDRVVKLNEGPIWDKVKGAAGKAIGAVAQKAGQIGTNLTTKITADKLNSAWKKAGSPMDSEEVAAILKQAGVGDDIVGKVYTDLKLPAPGAAAETPAAASAYKQVKDQVLKLNSKERKRIASYLQKQLGTA